MKDPTSLETLRCMVYKKYLEKMKDNIALQPKETK